MFTPVSLKPAHRRREFSAAHLSVQFAEPATPWGPWVLHSVLAILVSIAASGCSLHRGFPSRPSPDSTAEQLKQLQKVFSQDEKNKCEKTPTKECRNLIINCVIQAMDLQFDAFSKEIYASGAFLNSAGDLAVIGLSTAGAVVGATAMKAILAAVSAAVTGSKAAIDKDLMYQKSTQTLITRMQALRREQLVPIRAQLTKEWTEYSLSTALVDLEAYYNAGSIVAAISSIDSESGTKTEAADAKIQALALKNTALAQ